MKIPEYYNPRSAPIGLAIFGLGAFGKDYQPFMIGLEARGQVGHIRTFRVRRGNGEYGSVLGQKYQDEMIYYTPTNPQTAPQQNWRTVFRAGVWKWSNMTTEEKAPWIAEAKKHRTWTPFLTFMSAWLKYLWKEQEMRVPDYDSGFLAIAQNEQKVFTHNVGGNADNYLVDVTGSGSSTGKTKFAFGTRVVGGDYQGYYWHHLTNSAITVYRPTEDPAIEQVRVRIWRYA